MIRTKPENLPKSGQRIFRTIRPQAGQAQGVLNIGILGTETCGFAIGINRFVQKPGILKSAGAVQVGTDLIRLLLQPRDFAGNSQRIGVSGTESKTRFES